MKEKIGAKSLFQHLADDVILHNTAYPVSEHESRQIVMMILEHYLNISHTDVLLNKLIQIDPQSDRLIKDAVRRVNNAEPIQYILGEADFYGYKFKVSPSVLIPRRETEELVHLITHRNKEHSLRILDIGTGSGCIAITLKRQIPHAEVHAWDISEDALAVTRQNAASIQVDISAKQIDILNFVPEKDIQSFDIIASNPPYVCEIEKAQMHQNVLNFEPEIALFVPNEQPLIFYEKIAKLCVDNKLLKKGGILYFEINEQFAQQISQILHEQSFTDIRVIKDMQKKDRFVSGMLSS